MALVDAAGGGTGLFRSTLPGEYVDMRSPLAEAAALLLLERSRVAAPAFAPVVEGLLDVLVGAVSTIQVCARGTRESTVIYAVGADWSVDVVVGAEGECTMGLLPTGAVPTDLVRQHLGLDAELDLTLLIRGAAGPFDLVFVDGALVNGNGDRAMVRGSGVPPSEFAALLESAVADRLSSSRHAGSAVI
ncbi:hypothetical protein C1I64_11135 [Rathayibacter festucae DSM 15932]|uniref:Uncharacterized protein n=2 Tax=Rathayibacter festucae TaxID=110937 RepID=A0A3Q9V0G7_9MICO|nr:hypothetical protein C1I64_11135 [Rathayibacter festucae DSM 15932]